MPTRHLKVKTLLYQRRTCLMFIIRSVRQHRTHRMETNPSPRWSKHSLAKQRSAFFNKFSSGFPSKNNRSNPRYTHNKRTLIAKRPRHHASKKFNKLNKETVCTDMRKTTRGQNSSKCNSQVRLLH